MMELGTFHWLDSRLDRDKDGWIGAEDKRYHTRLQAALSLAMEANEQQGKMLYGIRDECSSLEFRKHELEKELADCQKLVLEAVAGFAKA